MKRWLQQLIESDIGDQISLAWLLDTVCDLSEFEQHTDVMLAALDELDRYDFTGMWIDFDSELTQKEAMRRWRDAVLSGEDQVYDVERDGPFLILDKMPDWWHDLPPLEDDEDESDVQPLT